MPNTLTLEELLVVLVPRAAREVGIKVPPDIDAYNPQEYAQFEAMCAEVLALPDEALGGVTYTQLVSAARKASERLVFK